jgi:hypothetical protein
LYYSHSTKEIGQVVIKGVDPLWFLSTRLVAWEPDITDRSIFHHSVPKIIKLLVKYNATAAATVAAGRLREGNIPEVTLNDFHADDVTYWWECSYENLLTTLQEVTTLGVSLGESGDFYMFYLGAGLWEFCWKPICLGLDRSAALTFSLEMGTMSEPVYICDRRKEKTVAIVAGGVIRDSSRASIIEYSSDYSASNDAEVYVPLPGVINHRAMEAGADAALFKVKKIDALTFKCFQTSALFYGVDYFLGDLVTTIYQGVTRIQQIHSLALDAAPTGETSLRINAV